MSRTMLTACLAILVLAIALTAGPGCTNRKAGEITIGAVCFLTGGAAQYGEWTKNGMDLAVNDVNSAGGIDGWQLRILYEDDQTSPQVAATALKKLVEVDRLPIVVGAVTSGSFLAMAPIAERSKILLFSPCSSSPAITEAGDYVFRNWPSDDLEGRVMADYAYDTLDLRSVSMVVMNNDYGVGLRDVFRAEFESRGGKVLGAELFEENTTDFRSIVTKVSMAKPDAVYLPSHAREAGFFVRQMTEMGSSFQILSCVTFESPELLEVAHSAADGAYYTAPAFDVSSSTGPVVAFREEYRKTYGTDPEVFAATAYDAIKILTLAIQRGTYSADGVKEQLSRITNYQGVSGTTSFDANGDVVKPVMIKVVRDQRFVPVQVVSD